MDYVKKNKALRVLRTLSIVQFVLIILLMILGGVCNGQHGQSVDGVPPYYIGVFVIAPLALVTAIIGLSIYFRGRHCFNKNVAAQKLGCLMKTYCILLPFNWLGCLVAVLIAGFSGICVTSKCSYIEHTGRNYRLAVTIVIFLLMIFVTDVIGLVVLCIHSRNFGIVLFSRGQYRISNISPESAPPSVYATSENVIGSFQIQNQVQHQSNHSNRGGIQTLDSNQRSHPSHGHSHHDIQSPRLSDLNQRQCDPDPHTEMYRQIRDETPNLTGVTTHGGIHTDTRGQNRTVAGIAQNLDSELSITNIHEQMPSRTWSTERNIEPDSMATQTQFTTQQQSTTHSQSTSHHQSSHTRRRQNRGSRQSSVYHQTLQTSHRKKKKRKNVRPSHPPAASQGQSYVLPPIVSHGLPPPPPSPPPPPNTPPPPLSNTNSFDDDSPPPSYYINEYVNDVHNANDPPPPYIP